MPAAAVGATREGAGEGLRCTGRAGSVRCRAVASAPDLCNVRTNHDAFSGAVNDVCLGGGRFGHPAGLAGSDVGLCSCPVHITVLNHIQSRKPICYVPSECLLAKRSHVAP